MSKVAVEQNGTRLDVLVLTHYGDLDMYDAVLNANVNLNTAALSIGDVVEMPHKVATAKEDKLW